MLRGRKTTQQAAQELAAAFEAMGDGIVTLAEFQQYYSNVCPYLITFFISFFFHFFFIFLNFKLCIFLFLDFN